MKMPNRIILLALMLVAPAIHAATLKLKLDSLPSAQGWTYHANGPFETNTYLVDGTSLIQNTMGSGTSYADYVFPGIVNSNLPFTMRLRARVLKSEHTACCAPATAFIVAVFTGTELFGLGLNTNSICVPYGSGTVQEIDATKFHDYRVEGVPGASINVFVDNELVTSGTPVPYTGPAGIILGDGSSFENGLVEITNFCFVQEPLILSVRVSELELCWNSQTNKAYQLQYRSTLTTNEWVPLGLPVLGNGSTNCVPDKVPAGQPQKYYRVQELP